MLDLCQPCKDKGILRAVYKTIGGIPMCGGCVADHESKPQAKPQSQALEFLNRVTTKEEAMEKICKCGCGEKLRSDNETGYRTGHKPAGGGDSFPSPKYVAARPKPSPNGHFSVNLSAEGLDAVWSALPAEKKAELLGNL